MNKNDRNDTWPEKERSVSIMKKKLAKCMLSLLTFSSVISAGIITFGDQAVAGSSQRQDTMLITEGEEWLTDGDEGGSYEDWITDGEEGGFDDWITDGEESEPSIDDFYTNAEEYALSINAQNFPDPVFRAYVKNTFDTSKDDKLSHPEIKNVVAIDVSQETEWITDAEEGSSDDWITDIEEARYFSDDQITDAEEGGSDDWITDAEEGGASGASSKISDLTGIQHFLYLKSLNCSGNLLSALDVSQNIVLSELNCADNRLTSIDISKNKSLTKLNVSGNQLKTLHLGALSKLQELKADRNQIAALDISSNQALRTISAKQNKISYTGTNMDMKKYDPAFDVSKVSGRKGLLFKGTVPVFKKGFYQSSYTYDVSSGYKMTVQVIRKKPESPQKWIFSDVNIINGNWKYEAVKYISEEGIMGAVGGSTFFQPDHPLSRAMLATILYRMAGEPDYSGTNTFPDVIEGSWYYDAVCWAKSEGIINGYPDGIFGTDDMVTREQTAKMLYLYAAYEGYPTGTRQSLAEYIDVSKVSPWASDYIQWCVSQKIITGKPTDEGGMKIDPQGNATRAECAKMIRFFLQNIAGAK